MNGRAWLVLLLFLGWSAGSWYWYTCKIKGFCGDAPVAEVEKKEPKVKEAVVKYGPLSYGFKDATAFTTDEFDGYITAEVKKGTDGQVFVVSGPYYKGEDSPPGFDNMGLARAAQVRDLMREKLDAERIELSSHLVGEYSGGDKRFEGTRFKWVTRNDNVQETIDGALIYFPYDSDKRITNPNITAYLERLAKDLKTTDNKVDVVGHTDSKGNDAYNKKLGMERAKSIKETLIEKGVKATSISVDSKGEEQPIATNDTDEGRQKNRRTEIKIKR